MKKGMVVNIYQKNMPHLMHYQRRGIFYQNLEEDGLMKSKSNTNTPKNLYLLYLTIGKYIIYYIEKRQNILILEISKNE